MNEIEKRIINAIQAAGIVVEDEVNEDIDLKELIEDSLQFVSMIINLEDEFQVEIPDDFLIVDKLQSFKGLVVMIDDLVKMGV